MALMIVLNGRGKGRERMIVLVTIFERYVNLLSLTFLSPFGRPGGGRVMFKEARRSEALDKERIVRRIIFQGFGTSESVRRARKESVRRGAVEG